MNDENMDIAHCILCDSEFIPGESGNELGFCIDCQNKKSFPYDIAAYYKDLDAGKTVFKGFDTMGRGILENYLKTKNKTGGNYESKL